MVGTNAKVASEGYDRESLALPGRQDELVAAVNPRTVVIVNSGSPVLMPWPNDASAVLLGAPGRHHGKIRSRALKALPGMACELVEYPTLPFRLAPLVGVRAMGKVGDTKACVHGNVLLRRLDAFRR